jgi:hypothetical protein
MPVSVLTTRVIDASGQVTAVHQAPFLVLDPEEELEAALAELEQAIADVEAAAEELLTARHDEHHPHHHWWQL